MGLPKIQTHAMRWVYQKYKRTRLGLPKIQTHAMRWVYQKYKRTRWDDDALLCFGLVHLYLSKRFARWVYKIQTHAMTWRCVALFSDWCVCILVNYFCKMGLQKYKRTRRDDDTLLFFSDWCVCIFVKQNTNARDDTTMRCFVSDWCVCILVNYLQDVFTKMQTHATTRRCVVFFRIGAFVSW